MNEKTAKEEFLQWINIVRDSNDDKEIIHVLQKVVDLFPKSDHPSPISNHFFLLYYVRFANILLQRLNQGFLSKWSQTEEKDIFDNFFLKGNPRDALLCLMDAISQSSPSYKQDKCLDLLERFVTGECFTKLFDSESLVISCDGSEEMMWDVIIGYIVSLPEKISNRTRDKTRCTFLPGPFFKHLSRHFQASLDHVYTSLQNNQDHSLRFHGLLLGRVALSGNADVMLGSLVTAMSPVVSTDFLWQRIYHKLISNVPERCAESVLQIIVKSSPWYHVVSAFLGDAIVNSFQMKFVLTNKFLFTTHFYDNRVLQNIIGYISDGDRRRSLLTEVLLELLTVWGDSSSLKHTSYDQHLYITKAVIVAAGFLNSKEKSQLRNEILKLLMDGVSSHLSSPLTANHRLGMVTAELLTSTLGDREAPSLNFTYEDDDETKSLKSLINPPSEPQQLTILALSQRVNNVHLQPISREAELKVDSQQPMRSKPLSKVSEDKSLDSDDDLEPYDMSHDTPLTKTKKPVYLRDCLEALMEHNNPDLFEMSLKEMETLIRKQTSELAEVAIDVSRVLVNLEDHFNTQNFVSLRHNALVATAVLQPIKVSDYLIDQFYHPNYNIRQRLDILQVLSSAAQELSKPKDITTPPAKVPPPLDLGENPVPLTEDWKSIVQHRVEAKTRRFVRGPSKSLTAAVSSKFAAVAGYFFFPLIHRQARVEYNSEVVSSDPMLLGRLVYTLGTVMHCALHAPVARQMGQSLLEYIWIHRHHTEPYIRKSLMFSVCMVMISVPTHSLINDLQDLIIDYKNWLSEVAEQDANAECVELACHSLQLIDTTIKKALEQEAT